MSLSEGNAAMAGDFPLWRNNKSKIVSISWRHHDSQDCPWTPIVEPASVTAHTLQCSRNKVSRFIPASQVSSFFHVDVIKWKHFPRYWSFVRGIPPSQVNSKGQWRGALMFSMICAWINGWVNNHGAVDLRRHCAHNDVTVILIQWRRIWGVEIQIANIFKTRNTRVYSNVFH